MTANLYRVAPLLFLLLTACEPANDFTRAEPGEAQSGGTSSAD